MKARRWTSMRSATASTTSPSSSTAMETTGTDSTGARNNGFGRALASTVRRSAAAAAAAAIAARPQRVFFPSDDETTSASPASNSSPPSLPSPCAMTERSPPAGADDGLADDDDDRTGQAAGDDDGGESDCWSLWYIHGRAYDLSSFMATHPGGSDALALARGRDCTALFESYHPFSDKPRQMLPKFLVPSASVPPELVVLPGEDGFFLTTTTTTTETQAATCIRDPFWEALRRECGAYLAQHQVELAMTWPFFLFGLAVIALQVAIFWHGFRHGSFPAAVALGLTSWLVAGTFGHEGLHWGISRRYPWLNHVLGFYATATMANPIIWKHQHTYSHHSFTNDHARDPDCHHFERMLRMHFANKHRPLHRFLVHRLWVFLFWSQAMFGSVVLLPIKTLATGAIQGATSMRTLSWRGRLGIVLHTVALFAVLWLLPYATMRRAKMAALGLQSAPLVMPDLVLRMSGLFTCFQTTIGALFGVFTQCTHLTSESMAATVAPHNSWARRQVETAANFEENSLFWFIFSGGLNLQIEHHLFPLLSHGALRELTPLIRKVCVEHGVHFKSYPTFGDLLNAVLEYFEQLASVEQKQLTAAVVANKAKMV